jgi:hypothetical protein
MTRGEQWICDPNAARRRRFATLAVVMLAAHPCRDGLRAGKKIGGAHAPW